MNYNKIKLCVFPNDPIIAYFEKGEIKPRYFNPENLFDEIHIISLTEKDIDEEKVKSIAGTGKLKIHNVGKINLKNYKKEIVKVLKVVEEINPDIIRAHNPMIEGWLAAQCAKKLKIPLFVSLHIQLDIQRELYKKTNFKKYLGMKFLQKFIEPYVIKNANIVTIVYKIIEPYVIKNRNEKPIILYNKIDVERFANGNQIDCLPKPLILSVGRLTIQKNHECLIEAMKQIDANLIIIGNGESYNKLTALIKKNNLESRIFIKKSVPNLEIQDYYKSADIFALAYDTKLEGMPIPVMEAMASGLPVVIPFTEKGLSDGLEEVIVFSKPTPNSFAENINKILANDKLRLELVQKSQNKAKDFDIEILEKKEADIYRNILKNHN